MKIAIVHDYLNQYGGAEKVVEVFHEMFPDAPVFTSIYDSKSMPTYFNKWDIKTSFMQKLPFMQKHFKKYLLFYPKAIESFNFEDFDIILSSSSAFGKGAIKGKNACHICYCHAPMRFVWEYDKYVEKENIGLITKNILPWAIKKLKQWDLDTINRVDYYIANSNYTKDKIRQYYNRESTVFFPPINVRDFKKSEKIEDYFLIVSRLNAYKNIDLAITAFSELGLKLKIVGSGPSRSLLESMANDNIEFLGRLNDRELKDIYSKCRAYIFPGKEDFGISPVEAQASGRPVIAFGEGGALETVIDGLTGILFKENSKQSLKNALYKFIQMENDFSKERIIKHVFKFDKNVFIKNLKNFIEEKYAEHIYRKKD